MKATYVRVANPTHSYEDFHYRTPIKFGGVALDRVTLLNVECTASNPAGKTARGFGSMPLGNIWSFPSRLLNYDATLDAMKRLAGRIQHILANAGLWGHPITLGHQLEPQYERAAEEVTRELGLPEPIPRLCTMVVASAFDAAVHDAYGKLHGRNCYHTYGPDFLDHDLGYFLGDEFAGETLEQYISRDPQPRMPLYHLIGALDPLTAADVTKPLDDGLPMTLPEWIRFNGLTHLKIKLNGDDLAWDVERVVGVDRVSAETQRQRGVSRWCYSLDFNERCGSVAYLLEFLGKVRERTPEGFDRIAYIEQPTARDLKADRGNVMHEAAKLRPVVIDESLVDLESLRLAREMGYTGAALKACKGQGQSLLLAAAARKYGMFLCVQDLSCPGASLIHSAGLAAHVPGVSAIESNARQYLPDANRPWEERFPGIFRITDGTMATGCLTGLGLGAVAE
ncbi:MAG TPA: enolase C-terminal domain-like protein [Gemmataceae bacterium]|nr:enolase C-terminal domain-like protein [Gemmataceae bacterium]